MTQEEKQLLLKDLCARLPYGVKGLHRREVHELFTVDGREANNACIQVDGYDAWFSVDTFKPYLRPMSSMTEEEREEWADLFMKPILELEQYTDEKEAQDMAPILYGKSHSISIDWLLSHHFDYRGLIPMGLALEAKEGMYEKESV